MRTNVRDRHVAEAYRFIAQIFGGVPALTLASAALSQTMRVHFIDGG